MAIYIGSLLMSGCNIQADICHKPDLRPLVYSYSCRHLRGIERKSCRYCCSYMESLLHSKEVTWSICICHTRLREPHHLTYKL